MPKSRTAKVRQAAARYQKVKIVSPNWLYDSISNWRKEPEENYLIEIHPEDRHESSLNGFQEIDDAQMLSTEDEESDEMDEEIPSSPADELNAPDMANVGWMDVDEEFKAWIGSDDEEDEEEENDEENGDEGEEVGGENESMASVSTVKSTSGQKRPVKRSRSPTPVASQETNSDDIMDESADKSRAVKRQRTLSDRSLKAEGVEAVGEVAPTEDLPETSTDLQEGAAMEAHEEIDDDDDFDDDSFLAEFERELLAEIDDDEEGEAEKEVTIKEATSLKEENGGIVHDGDGGGSNEDRENMVGS